MSVLSKIRQSLVYLIQNGLPAEEVSESEARDRIEVCEACPEFWSGTRQCSICKCFMDVKTKLKYDPVRSVAQAQPVLTACAHQTPKW